MDKNEKTQMSLTDEGALYTDVCGIIDGVRGRLATYINAEICMTNWYVGKRVKEDVLDNQRASYGKQVVKNLASKLTAKYGNGWGFYKLQHCLRAASVFTEDEIVYAVRTQLSWTQLRSLMGSEYEGQMLLYLRYLNQNERKSWEKSPIGLILCSEGNTEHIQYLMLDENSPVKVAQYYTQLPDKAVLAEKLKKPLQLPKNIIGNVINNIYLHLRGLCLRHTACASTCLLALGRPHWVAPTARSCKSFDRHTTT